MLPDDGLTFLAVTDQFMVPARNDPNSDYEYGSAAIGAADAGRLSHLWHSEYDGSKLELVNSEMRFTALELADISSHSFAFDQNMRPAVAYVRHGRTALLYRDAAAGEYIIRTFGEGFHSPQLSLDDPREQQISRSDIILSYVRNGLLCYRRQRDRYLIEHVLSDAKNQKLTQAGMTRNLRWRWRLVFDWRNE